MHNQRFRWQATICLSMLAFGIVWPSVRRVSPVKSSKRTWKQESDLERDRALAALAKGRPALAWRFAAISLADPRLDANTNGLITLEKITANDPSAIPPAKALLEQTLVLIRSLDAVEEALLIWLYDSLNPHVRDRLYKMPPIDKIEEWIVRDRRRGYLGKDSISFCTSVLSQSNQHQWWGAIPILLEGAKLGGADRNWSVRQCKRLWRISGYDASTTWGVLCETVVGHNL